MGLWQNTTGLCATPQVALLFEAHKDLLTEFTYFLPDNTAPERTPARVQPCSHTVCSTAYMRRPYSMVTVVMDHA